MVRFGRIVYNLTGIMSNRGLVKNSNKIGEAVCDKMKASDGKITPAEIEKIITDTIGKKGAKRIKIVDSTDEAKKYALEHGNISAEEFDNMYGQILGFACGDKYKREAILHVKSIDDSFYQYFGHEYLADAISHETQHAMSFSSGKFDLIKKFSKIPFVRKLIDKEEVLIRQLGIQDKYSSIQLLALGEDVLTPEKARELVQKVLKNGDDKNNLFTIKTLIKYYKDEIRSYTVGYEAHSKYLGQELPQAKSIIERYEKLVMALKQERVNIVKNKIKDFIGLG